jgi:hypothetical protein
MKAALDAIANALAVAVLLASRLQADHAELRRAINAAATALSSLKPSGEHREG